MKWFKNIKGHSQVGSKFPNKYLQGLKAFEIGSKLYKEKEDESISQERKKQKTIAAIEFFDTAIENDFNDPDVYCYRGYCLLDLQYELDALDDFNRCVEIDPSNASYYQHRALTKSYLHDYDGSLLDYKEAIRLSKIPNSNTIFWNEIAIKMGWNGFTSKLEFDLAFLNQDIKRSKNIYNNERIIKEIANQKRRGQ